MRKKLSYLAAYCAALDDVDKILSFYIGPQHITRRALRLLHKRINHFAETGELLPAPTHQDIETAFRGQL